MNYLSTSNKFLYDNSVTNGKNINSKIWKKIYKETEINFWKLTFIHIKLFIYAQVKLLRNFDELLLLYFKSDICIKNSDWFEFCDCSLKLFLKLFVDFGLWKDLICIYCTFIHVSTYLIPKIYVQHKYKFVRIIFWVHAV